MTVTAPTHSENPATQTTRWRIDPARSSVEFRTPTLWGLTKVHGSFERYQGTLDLGREPAIELEIEADSLDTHNKVRDKHLRSPDFFDVQNHPHVRFVSDSARLVGERLRVRGTLYAGGESIPLDLTASLRQIGDELQVDVSTSVDHRRLGMTHSTLGMIRGLSELSVSGRLVPVRG